MTPTVVCIWDPTTCQWGTQTVYERDAWTALHTHLTKVHGHDVHAEHATEQVEVGESNSVVQGG